ncbi:MAG: hypothetical protein H7144_05225 [Burkholderiales bacterium]|nr:hypothetical protein [Phycisphaerae bacterium]
MSTVKEIVDAIRHLTPDEREQLDELLHSSDALDDSWDRQMKSDAEAGKLDAIAEQALADAQMGKAKPWP